MLIQIFEYIYEQSDKIDDTFGKIEANTNLGIYYFNKFQNDSAYYFLSRAEKLSKNQKGLPFIGSILESKADLLWCQKNFTEAESTAIKALRIAIKKKNNELKKESITTENNTKFFILFFDINQYRQI